MQTGVSFRRMVYILMVLFATAAVAQPVLFIDLNNAPSEIKAVSGVRAVDVVPTYATVNKQTRLEIENLHRQNDRVQAYGMRCYIDEVTSDCARLERMFGIQTRDQYYNFIRDTGIQRRQLFPEFKAIRLEDEILSLGQSAYETVVISGHHSNGYMSGELVEAFQFNVLKDMVARHPDIFSRVKYLIILGCNSGQKEIIVQWQRVFPTSEIVVASAGIAPIKTDARNLSFIKKLMIQIDGLSKKENWRETFDAALFLNQVRTSGWPVAILYQTKSLNYLYKN